ncbi:MAG: translocation/assembly module TamB domain-containing protein [Candidatus Sulfotelmatobacter sp.]
MRWRKIVGGGLVVIGVLVIAIVVGGYFFLKSEGFRNLALRTIVKDANEATGARTEIRDFDFQLSTLTAHLYNITLHGSESADEPPLLQVDKLTVGVEIESILRRKISLSELAVEHPVANMRVGPNGKSNLPQAPPNQTSSNTNIFDLAAKHVSLTDGQVHYNDETIPLDAELYGLRTEIHFEPIATTYRGTISYDSGSFRYGNELTLSHSLNTKFTATPAQFSVDSAELKVGSSVVSFNAKLVNYENPTAEGQYDLHIHTQDFSSMARPVVPAGDVALAGTVHYQSAPNKTLLQSLSMNGQLGSEELAAYSKQGRISLRRFRGRYQFLNGSFEAQDVNFETLGGKVSTDIELHHLDTTPTGRVRTTLRGISLQAAQKAVHTTEVMRLDLTSKIDGAIEASWTGSVSNILARADLTMKAASDSAAESSRAVPMNGTIHASYDAPRDIVTLRDTSIRIPSATLSAQGEVSQHSQLHITADATDLHELAEMISSLGANSAKSLEIAGSASMQALVQGSMQRPQLTGQVSAKNLQVEGSSWSTAKLELQASPARIVLRNGALVNSHQGRAEINGTVALTDWSYQASSPVNATLSVQRMAIADLQRLANVQYPVSGDLTAAIAFHGSQNNPAGHGTARIDDAVAYNEPIQHLSATFSADKKTVTSNLEVTLPAGSANGTISYTPESKAYMARLNAPSVTLQRLQVVQAKNLGISGTLAISANGSGTLDKPQLSAVVQVPQLQLRDKSISQLKAQLNVANQRAELSLDSQVAESTVHSHANVDLSGDYYAEAAIDTTSVPLGPLLAMYLPNVPQGFQGATELHATLKGPLKDNSRVEAHLTIPTLKASYQSLEIGAASPIRADYVNSVITLQPAEIRGTDTSLRLQGSFPLAGTATPTLTAQGTIDVRILRIVEPDVQSSGTIALDVRTAGAAKNPDVQGKIHIQDVAISTPTAPLGVQKLNGTLDVSDRSVQFTSLTGEVGGGQVSLGGSISYRPNLQFSVSLQSKSVRLRYPDGVRAMLDGNLALSGTKDASTLNGRVLIDSLSFTPDFDLTKFSDQFSGNVVPSEPGLADNVKLAVSVQSKSDLSAISSQVSIEGQVNLQVVGTAANPVIIGRTDLTSGELFYRNVRYQLQRGLITFDNPSETEPVLNVSATSTVEQYNLTITLRGPFDKLTTSYTSDPPLATADIINLIANGQTTQEAAAAGQTTDSMIASQVASQVTGGIQHLAGISSLQIDPLLGGNNQNPSARVAIQQRVTKNFLFTFSTDLSQPGSEIVQGDYQINKRWSVSVTRDEVGGISVDGKYHTKF